MARRALWGLEGLQGYRVRKAPAAAQKGHAGDSLVLLGLLALVPINQQFSTTVLQEFLKHVIPDHLIRGTDPFSLT